MWVLAHRHVYVDATARACVKKAFSSSERCEFKITVTEIEIEGER